MLIEENKQLKLKNVLSIRRNMIFEHIEKEVYLMGIYIQSKESAKNGPLVTCIHKFLNKKKLQLLDTEILIPINKAINVTNSTYVFYEIFTLDHCIYTRVIGDASKMQHIVSGMEDYLRKNRLKQLTSAYIVQIKDLSQVIKATDMIFDFYIGYA